LSLSAQARAEGLMDVVAAAQANDPEFQSARSQNLADAEATKQAWARFLPHVHGSFNYNFTNQDIVSSDNKVYAIGDTSYPDYGYDITIDQSLFNWADWANLKAAKALRRQSNATFEVAKQDLLLRVVERYFTVLVASETADASRAETRAIKEHLDLTESKHERGAARDAELLDAQARYQQALAKQVQVDSAVRDAMAGLKEITGELPGSLSALSDKLQIKPLTPDNTQHWVELADTSNPRITAANEAANRSQAEVSQESDARLPTASLQVYQDRHKTLGSLFGGGSDIEEYGGRFKVDVPLYSGGAVSSRVRQAKDMLKKAQFDAERSARGVERETEEAVDGIKTATARVAALQASVVAQEKVVDQLSAAYRAGVSSSVEYLDAQRDLFLARAEYVRSRYDYALDTVKLRHAVGLLAINDLAEIDHQLVARTAASGDAPPPANGAAPPK
jgi:outer membrane protein